MLCGLEQVAPSAAFGGPLRASDARVLIESDACMSEDPRHLTVTERPRRTHSYFCHTRLVPVASLLFCRAAAWRHGRTLPGERRRGGGGAQGSHVTWAGPC